MPRTVGAKGNPNINVEASIAKLIANPIVVEEDIAIPSTEKIALLLNRIKKAQQGPEVFHYSTDFHYFLLHAVKTRDEGKGGIVAHIPSFPYLKELCDALLTCHPLLIEKSRRVLASWVQCAFDVWIAAGGQDPRWPILMNATGNRQVVIASRKLKDPQGSVWFLRNRVKFIVDQLEQSNIRDKWPEFPHWEWTETEARCSNGSYISAVASGADQTRGLGATLIHAEEISFWPEAQPSIEGALPTLAGGGHFVGITTPQAGTYAARIVHGHLKAGADLYNPEENDYDELDDYEKEPVRRRSKPQDDRYKDLFDDEDEDE